jgi:hypothetical protein
MQHLSRAPKYLFSLLCVSRQVYTEKAMLVYKMSTFSFFIITDLGKWIRYMPPLELARARSVRKIKTCCFDDISPILCVEQFTHFSLLDRLDIHAM